MDNKIEIKLIDGIFNEENAKEIILTMINKKIEFNEIKGLGNLVKRNEEDNHLEQRTKELKIQRQNIINHFNKNNNERFEIQAIIRINHIL